MTSDGAVAWTKNVTRNAPTYKNEVTASSMLAMAQYSTARDAKRITIPLRAITAESDTITPAKKIHEALAGVKSVDFKDFPGTHFGPTARRSLWCLPTASYCTQRMRPTPCGPPQSRSWLSGDGAAMWTRPHSIYSGACVAYLTAAVTASKKA